MDASGDHVDHGQAFLAKSLTHVILFFSYNCFTQLTQIPGSTSYFGAIGTDAYGETLGTYFVKEVDHDVNDHVKNVPQSNLILTKNSVRTLRQRGWRPSFLPEEP